MITQSSLGISTACLYPTITEEALQTLLDMGFGVFEVFLNAQQEFSHEYLKALKKRADAYGAVFTSVHPYTSAMESMLLFGEYDRRTQEGIDLYKGFMESAAVLGAKYVVIHGQQRRGATPKLYDINACPPDEKYWNIFGRLYEAGNEAGAHPAQENVVTMKSSHPAFIRGMREYLGSNCAFVLDTKQCRLSGVKVEEMAAAMGSRLCHVHISDCRGQEYPCLLPGFGEFDFKAFFALLEDMGYQGRLVTEVYNFSYGEVREIEISRKKMINLF